MCSVNKERLTIPGYDGHYWIDRGGTVYNSLGHTIKPTQSKAGLCVELRKFGQREKVLILDLLNKAGYSTLGGMSNEDG